MELHVAGFEAGEYHSLRMKVAHTTPYRFACTGCGHCCTGNPKDFWVEVSRTEQVRIAKHLGISLAWLRRRYLVREAEGDGISMRGGQCVFLDGKRCGIYAVRPTQCRTYPFWPELMTDKAWRAEAKRCEGMGRGAIVPLEKIRRLLKRANTV
jgi:Fe-S-cluster containining protein